MVKNLGYQSKGKELGDLKTTLVTNHKTINAISKYIGKKISEWLVDAGIRFMNLSNPLAQLFEGRGLWELADMYNLHDQKISSKKVTCKRGS